MVNLAPTPRKARPTVVERSLPTGLGSAVKAFEQLLRTPVESADGVALLELTHRLHLRGFGVEGVVTLQLAESPDRLTVDVTLAEASDGTSMVRLATRGACRDRFDSAAAVLHDVAFALEAQCRIAAAIRDLAVT